MTHHTASGPSSNGWPDVNFIAWGSQDAPLANLYLDRAGVVFVIAAGATNTNGKGHDSWGGGVPDDAMNTHAIGIEAANAGTGELWPSVQQDAYVTLVRALCSAYGIANDHVRAHFEWAPARKIDQAGASRWASGAASWDMPAFRTSCRETPTPPILEGDDEMILIRVESSNGYAVFTCTPSGVVRWVPTGTEADAWDDDASTAVMPPSQFQQTVDNGRTLGEISADVVAITGVSVERWGARKLAV